MHREIWFESAEVPIYDILALHLSYIYKKSIFNWYNFKKMGNFQPRQKSSVSSKKEKSSVIKSSIKLYVPDSLVYSSKVLVLKIIKTNIPFKSTEIIINAAGIINGNRERNSGVTYFGTEKVFS